MGPVPAPGVESSDKLQMVQRRQHIHRYAGPNKRSPKPEREPVSRLWASSMLRKLKVLQEEAEASYHEAESHESQAGTNPCKKCSLRGQIISLLGSLIHLLRRVHLLSLCGFAARDAFHVTEDCRSASSGTLLLDYGDAPRKVYILRGHR
jgi:hypothetical protein